MNYSKINSCWVFHLESNDFEIIHTLEEPVDDHIVYHNGNDDEAYMFYFKPAGILSEEEDSESVSLVFDIPN